MKRKEPRARYEGRIGPVIGLAAGIASLLVIERDAMSPNPSWVAAHLLAWAAAGRVQEYLLRSDLLGPGVSRYRIMAAIAGSLVSALAAAQFTVYGAMGMGALIALAIGGLSGSGGGPGAVVAFVATTCCVSTFAAVGLYAGDGLWRLLEAARARLRG